jgi:predicted kinase
MEKNLIVEILVGIPASGKSTYSQDRVRNDSSWSRVNRDDFRFMLKNAPVCEPKVEKIISKLMYASIDALLAKNLNVIVDNTHLKAKYINELIAYVEHRADVHFRIFDISLDKALERDSKRTKKVGEQVIKKMYVEYKDLIDSYLFQNQSKKKFVFIDPPYNPALPDIVMFDIDGTLAHMNGKRGPFDWKRTDIDDPDRTVVNTFKDHMTLGHRIFVLSGRSDEGREPTEQWLDFYGLKYEKLLMRKKDDFRADNIVKEEIYNHYIKGKYNVKVIYDDRQQVVDMWRSLGLKVYQVEKGDF